MLFSLQNPPQVHNGLVLQGNNTYLESMLLKSESEYNHSCFSVGVKHVCSWCGRRERSWGKILCEQLVLSAEHPTCLQIRNQYGHHMTLMSTVALTVC